MRTALFSVVLLSIGFLVCTSYADEMCHHENCIPPDHCEEQVKSSGAVCKQEGTKCCSVVKSEYRTHCRHHGGICMNSCAQTLTRDTTDCTGGSVCCVLV